ncbi:C2H2 type zinc-finger-domain-containing protein [Scheffersomyces coipomensis]|uniref:C2H2 type zinc-finger-domain-containing protein n=1 Tax=Scheffersomyces coipomensis TaxID=1788519 RepID=UPI00315DE9FD
MSLFMPHGSNPQTSQFTCNTCGIRFASAELQRQHMKTDWHRYNLKRRVAELPSISSEMFAEKILNSKQLYDVGHNDSDEDEYGFHVNKRKSKPSENRQLTKKFIKRHERLGKLRGRRDLQETQPVVFVRDDSPSLSVTSEFSQFSLGDHIQHEIESLAETASVSEHIYSTESDGFLDEYEDSEDDEDEAETGDSDSDIDLDSIPIDHCFYCGQDNQEIENNVKHMFNKHGLYIPERSFLTNIEGLLHYISDIISIDNACLVCGFEGKNLESIRQHIYSKGHCKIPYESKDQKAAIAEFYTFYSDEPIEINKKTKSSRKVMFTEESEDIEDERDDLDDYDLDEDMNVDVEEDEDSSDNDNGINDNYALVQIDRSGVELTLPTGSRIGHRSMTRYYRQNITTPQELRESQRTVAVVDRRFASGLTYNQVTKEQREVRKIEERAKNNYHRRTKPSRVNYQKHFRDELLGPM